MKKICSIILTIAMIISCFSAFTLNSSADSQYEDLMEARMDYLINSINGYEDYLKNPENFVTFSGFFCYGE